MRTTMKQLDYKIEKIDDGRIQVWFGDVGFVFSVPLTEGDKKLIDGSFSQSVAKRLKTELGGEK